jgi:uncharacterized membrane protein YesL
MQMPNLIPEPGSLLDRIMTVVLGNMLWFVCSVPLVTLPAATAGLFAVLIPLVRDDDAELFATFFGTMRRQWFKSTVIVAADVVIGALIAINFSVLNMMNPPGPIFWLFRSMYIFVAMLTLLANLYLWPLLVLFDIRLRPLVAVSIKLAFTHPVWSLFTLGLALLPLSLAAFLPLMLSVVVIVSLTVLTINWGTWRIIKLYVTSEDLAGFNQ